MITTHLANLEARCRQRGYTLEEVAGCIVSRDGDTVTIDETHPDYPHPRKGLGDQLADGLAAVGITKARVSRLLGRPCKCKERQGPEATLPIRGPRNNMMCKLVLSPAGVFVCTSCGRQEQSIGEFVCSHRGIESTGIGRPGTELKKLLKKVGITASPNCSCNARARTMDQWGCDKCEERIDEIVGWLREEATKRNLPFVDMAGRMIVRRAIKNARKKSFDR